MTGEKISSEIKEKRRKNRPMCGKCRNHGILTPIALHKGDCPKKDCCCVDCLFTLQRRSKMRVNTAARREVLRKRMLSHIKELQKLNSSCPTKDSDKSDAVPDLIKSVTVAATEKKIVTENTLAERCRSPRSEDDLPPLQIKSDLQRIEFMYKCSRTLLEKFNCSTSKETLSFMYTILKFCLESKRDVEECILNAQDEIDTFEKHFEDTMKDTIKKLKSRHHSIDSNFTTESNHPVALSKINVGVVPPIGTCLPTPECVLEPAHSPLLRKKTIDEIESIEKPDEINRRIDIRKHSLPGPMPLNLRLVPNQWHPSMTNASPRIPLPINGHILPPESHTSPYSCPLPMGLRRTPEEMEKFGKDFEDTMNDAIKKLKSRYHIDQNLRYGTSPCHPVDKSSEEAPMPVSLKQNESSAKFRLPADPAYPLPDPWSLYYPRVIAPLGAPTYFDHPLGLTAHTGANPSFLFDPHAKAPQIYYKPLSPLSPERSTSSSEASASQLFKLDKSEE